LENDRSGIMRLMPSTWRWPKRWRKHHRTAQHELECSALKAATKGIMQTGRRKSLLPAVQFRWLSASLRSSRSWQTPRRSGGRRPLQKARNVRRCRLALCDRRARYDQFEIHRTVAIDQRELSIMKTAQRRKTPDPAPGCAQASAVGRGPYTRVAGRLLKPNRAEAAAIES